MRISFTKMHGLGNDFMVVRADGAAPPDARAIHALANRHTGVGFDQLLWLEAPRTENGDVFYRVFNSDGAEVEQCGNGARCIARLIGGEGPAVLRLEHAQGVSEARIDEGGLVSVDMGVPEFEPAAIPFEAAQREDVYRLAIDGENVEARILSVGNPHAVIQVTNLDDAPVQRLGPALESHDRFPNHANIGFMQVVSADRIRLRVYERGAGETLACGTGACAAVVAGRSSAQLAERVAVELPGGEVTVEWAGPGQSVWLTGEAVAVFEGTVDV